MASGYSSVNHDFKEYCKTVREQMREQFDRDFNVKQTYSPEDLGVPDTPLSRLAIKAQRDGTASVIIGNEVYTLTIREITDGVIVNQKLLEDKTKRKGRKKKAPRNRH